MTSVNGVRHINKLAMRLSVVDAPQVPAVSSLQRLLSLDQDVQDYGARLHVAAEILGIPEQCLTLSHDCNCSTLAGFQFHGRAEWLLRWILTKLKLHDHVGVEARSTASSWALLHHLIRLVPRSVAARLCFANKLLMTVITALEECHLPKNTDEHAITGDDEIKAVQNSRGVDDAVVSDVSRDGGTHQDLSAGATGCSSQKRIRQMADNFLQIHDILELLVELSNGERDKSEAIIAEQLKTVMRLEPNQAAQLLRFWLSLLNTFIMTKNENESMLTSHLPKLSTVLFIWDLSSVDAGHISDISVTLFSSECLLQAAVLLSLINEASTTRNLLPSESVQDIFVSLELLVAKYTFVSASTGFPSYVNGADQAEPAESDTSGTSLSRNLESLRTEIAISFDGPRRHPADRYRELALQSIPLLLEIAIRCAPKASGKTRPGQRAWLQAVFIALADCAGTPIYPHSIRDVPDMYLSCLEIMLDVLTRSNLSLDMKILQSIIGSYSGVLLKTSKAIRWSLVAKVFDLDYNVFLPINSDNTSAEAPDMQISSKLFARLSEERIAGAPFKDDALNDSPLCSGYTQLQITELVTIPLLKAYARSRQLRDFLDRWKKQLTVHYTVSECLKETDHHASILEDERLATALKSDLEDSSTASEIKGIVRDLVDELSATRSVTKINRSLSSDNEELPSRSSLGVAAASIVVLDAVLGGVHSDQTLDSLYDGLAHVVSVVLSLADYSDAAFSRQKFRIWRILSVLNRFTWNLNEDAADSIRGPCSESSCFQHALSDLAIVVGKGSESLPHGAFSSAYEAFTFILTLFEASDRFAVEWPSSNAVAEEALRYILAVVASVQDKILFSNGKLVSISWDGYAQSVDSLTIPLALYSSLVRYSAILKYCSSEHRKRLFRDVLLLSCTSTQEATAPKADQITFATVLEALIEIVTLFPSTAIRGDFVEVLFLELNSDEPSTLAIAGKITECSEWQYHQIPTNLLSRNDREMLLDWLLGKIIVPPSGADSTAHLRRLGLMVKLMEFPNATSSLSTDLDAVWNIAKALNTGSIEAREDVLRLVEELVKLNLKHILTTKDQPRSKSYLEKFSLRLSDVTEAADSYFNTVGTLIVIKATLAVCRHDPTADDSLYIDRWVARVLSTLQSDLEGFIQKTSNKTIPHLDVLIATELDTLVEVQPEHLTESGLVFEQWAHHFVERTPDVQNRRSIVSAYRVITRLLSQRGETLQCTQAVQLLRQAVTARDYQDLISVFQQSMTDLTPASRADLIDQTMEKFRQDWDFRALCVLLALIRSRSGKSAPPVLNQYEATRVLCNLCRFFATARDAPTVYVAADCIEAVLGIAKQGMSQFGIDTTVVSCAFIISNPSGPTFPSAHAPEIYTRVCGLMYQLVLLHRIRLNGRYHLVVETLQAIISCLFIPDTRQKATSLRVRPWMAGTLRAEHARLCARILTSLCSPTVSAVRRHRRHSQPDLVDETRKARDYAGKFMRGVIERFCKCQLEGRILPEMKEALMPGLYATLEAMTQESMRAMNAAMDGPTRAVWKGLYEQWRRFGQWKER